MRSNVARNSAIVDLSQREGTATDDKSTLPPTEISVARWQGTPEVSIDESEAEDVVENARPAVRMFEFETPGIRCSSERSEEMGTCTSNTRSQPPFLPNALRRIHGKALVAACHPNGGRPFAWRAEAI